jgi:tRNA (guanine-N7-)-methyltransferase
MSVTSPIDAHRHIRSFVVRSGRSSPEQKASCQQLYALYGVPQGQVIEPDVLFGRQAPLVIEIGFGMSHSLIEMAARRPECNFIGIEVHPPGVARALSEIHRLELTNLKIMQQDAIVVLSTLLAPESVDEVWLLFPDPWPKNKHHKRRIVQAPFIALVTQCLRVGGKWMLATDVKSYARWMVERLDKAQHLRNVFGPGMTVPETEKMRSETKFERRGHGLGNSIYDYQYERIVEEKSNPS